MFRRGFKDFWLHTSLVQRAQEALFRCFYGLISESCLQDKIDEILQDSGEEKTTGVFNVISRFLSGKRGLPCNFSDDYLLLLSRLFVERRLGRRQEQETIAMLSKQTEAIDSASVYFEYWSILSYLAISNGYYVLGGVFRDKAIQSCLVGQEKAGFYYLRNIARIKAAIDVGDFCTADKALSSLKKGAWGILQRKHLKSLEAHIRLMSGEKNEFPAFYRKMYTRQDEKYAEHINGKKVAIVGPAPSSDLLGEEIDSFDAVIRLNYYGKDTLPGKEEFGSLAHISYYNHINEKKVAQLPDRKFFGEIDFVNFKTKMYPYQKRLLKFGKARLILLLNKYLFVGEANMLQNVVYDLLMFEPHEIKIFKANFFLSRQAYHGGYQLKHQVSRKQHEVWRTHAKHNLVSQLNFLRSLWTAGLVKADKVCESVMDLSSAEYLQQMEEIYVNPFGDS